MGISNEMKRRATIIAISIKFDNFSRDITAKKPVKKCAERSEFFAYFLVSVRVVVVALSSLVLVALPCLSNRKRFPCLHSLI